MMPPHIHSSRPQPGGVLEGNVLLLEGYSLSYLDDGIVIQTGRWKKTKLHFELTASHESVGDVPEDQPFQTGCVEQKSTLKIRLLHPPASKSIHVLVQHHGEILFSEHFMTSA